MTKLIYLDNAATTKMAPEVVEAMMPYLTEEYGNPSAIYSIGAKNKEVISKQREIIADMIGAKANNKIQIRQTSRRNILSFSTNCIYKEQASNKSHAIPYVIIKISIVPSKLMMRLYNDTKHVKTDLLKLLKTSVFQLT